MSRWSGRGWQWIRWRDHRRRIRPVWSTQHGKWRGWWERLQRFWLWWHWHGPHPRPRGLRVSSGSLLQRGRVCRLPHWDVRDRHWHDELGSLSVVWDWNIRRRRRALRVLPVRGWHLRTHWRTLRVRELPRRQVFGGSWGPDQLCLQFLLWRVVLRWGVVQLFTLH